MPGLCGNPQVLHSPEFRHLSEYISSQTTLNEALDAFCGPVEEIYKSTGNASAVEERLWRCWKSIVTRAASTPYTDANRQKLVDFVLKLQTTRPKVQRDGQACVVQDMTLWSDLPMLGWEIREAWNAAASDDSDDQSKQQWVNLNAWMSTLVQSAQDGSNDNLDLSLYCIWAVRTALEDQEQPSDIALSAAAVWLANAAPTIWDLCRQQKSFEGKRARPGALVKDQAWTGFTEDRWRSWTQRLRAVEGQISDESTAQLVEQARKAMGDVVKE